jgi:hypothetical protein
MRNKPSSRAKNNLLTLCSEKKTGVFILGQHLDSADATMAASGFFAHNRLVVKPDYKTYIYCGSYIFIPDNRKRSLFKRYMSY